MPPFEIEYSRSAERDFRKLPRGVQERFARAFARLADDPRKARPGCDLRPLSGAANAWRIRVEEYRGIYAIEAHVIVFTRFGHRKRIYGR